jgi:hypothetical protein
MKTQFKPSDINNFEDIDFEKFTLKEQKEFEAQQLAEFKSILKHNKRNK